MLIISVTIIYQTRIYNFLQKIFRVKNILDMDSLYV